jgi:hypothetical protein
MGVLVAWLVDRQQPGGQHTALLFRCYAAGTHLGLLTLRGPAFAKSSDFAIDKPAGRACPNLQDDFRCGIHACCTRS